MGTNSENTRLIVWNVDHIAAIIFENHYRADTVQKACIEQKEAYID